MITKTSSCRYGLMTYLPHDEYVGKALDLYGEYSYGETSLWEQILQPGMNVVDVGANIGAHTVALASIVGNGGHVTAFEPQGELANLLLHNLQQNTISGTVHNYAIGASKGTLHFPPVDYTHPNNFGAVGAGLYEQGVEVPLWRLDDYFNSATHPLAIHFLKIDVEGMEPDVIRGGFNLITSHLPMMEIECDREGTLPLLQSLLEPLGYDLYWHITYLYNPDNYHSNSTNIYASQASINVFANVEGRYTNFRGGCLPLCKDLEVTIVRP